MFRMKSILLMLTFIGVFAIFFFFWLSMKFTFSESQLIHSCNNFSDKMLADGVARCTPCTKFNQSIVTVLNETENKQLPTIYIVTPTYRRPQMIAELTRLSYAFMHLENIVWLVIEDEIDKSSVVDQILKRSGIVYVHLNVKIEHTGGCAPCRNLGIDWIRENANNGVVYFADDDNTYDLALFDEMRNTEKVSMWPVGLCTETGVSTPIVKDGKFIGFFDGWMNGGRKFPVDMASFAISVKFLKERPNAKQSSKIGYQEDSLLRSLHPFEPQELELKAENCTKILVWHTKTLVKKISKPVDLIKYAETNLEALVDLMNVALF